MEHPAYIIFYWLDQNFNQVANYKCVKQHLVRHYGIDVKNARLLFKGFKERSGYISHQTFSKIIKSFDPRNDNLCKDIMEAKQLNPMDMDKPVYPPTADEAFSDISMKMEDIEQSKKLYEQQRKRDKKRKMEEQTLN